MFSQACVNNSVYMCVRDGTHPTGMHSCFKARKHSSRIRNTWLPPVCVSVAASRCQYWEGCRWVYLSHDTHPHSPLGYPPPPCGLQTPMINASLWHTCLSLAYLPLSGIPVPSGIPASAYPSFGIHPPQKGHETRDSHPPKGTWDQVYHPPEGTWDQGYQSPEGIWNQRYSQKGPQTRHTHPRHRQTDACENITFPKLLLRAVIKFWSVILRI